MNTEFGAISLSAWNSLGAASSQKRSYETLGIFSTEQNLLFFILNCPAASLLARSVYVRKMSSDSEMSDLSQRSSNTEEGETEEEEHV